MPIRDGISKLRDQVDKVLDKIDSPRGRSTPPPVPLASRPGQIQAYPYGGPYETQPHHYAQQQQLQQHPLQQAHQQQSDHKPWKHNTLHAHGGPSVAPAIGGRWPSASSSSLPPPPPPLASKPTLSASTPSLPALDQLPLYWSPSFVPQVPVSEYFDYDIGAGGWGNQELQTYTSLPTNSFHDSYGNLVLRCIVDPREGDPERYTSARLLSKQRLGRRRGYLAATIAAPRATGIWPAFWLLPEEPFKWPQDGEVDIFEAWNGSSVCHSCLHWGDYTHRSDKSKHRVINTRIPNIEGNHEYGFAWDQVEGTGDGGYMIWYIDGRPVMRAQRPAGTRRLESFRILINIAVGGAVCDGKTPYEGSYDMTVSRMFMSEEPPAGWYKFGQDWNAAPEGRDMR